MSEGFEDPLVMLPVAAADEADATELQLILEIEAMEAMESVETLETELSEYHSSIVRFG